MALSEVLFSLFIAALLGGFVAVLGMGMAKDMGGILSASVPGGVLGLLAGAAHAVRWPVTSLGVFWGACLLGSLVGFMAGFLIARRGPLEILASGLLFGLLGGGPGGLLGGGLIGAFAALQTLLHEIRKPGA